MIKVHKPAQPPACLSKAHLEKAMQEIIAQQKFQSKYSDLYKGKNKAVRKTLEHIYHRKCAYCEKDLRDAIKPVEHFRPKGTVREKNSDETSQGYYWLAFSWDNLLLACERCNQAKSNYFDIQGSRARYKGESYPDLHQLGASYDALEQPLLIHPEREDPQPLIQFRVNGSAYSTDPRMAYTLEITQAGNRAELCELRWQILKTLMDDLDEIFYQLFEQEQNGPLTLRSFLNRMERFQKYSERERPFSAWRQYILRYPDKFLQKAQGQTFNQILFAAVQLLKKKEQMK